MFSSPTSFALFFFTCMALVILGIIYEDQLIAIEDKYTKENHKKSKSTSRR